MQNSILDNSRSKRGNFKWWFDIALFKSTLTITPQSSSSPISSSRSSSLALRTRYHTTTETTKTTMIKTTTARMMQTMIFRERRQWSEKSPQWSSFWSSHTRSAWTQRSLSQPNSASPQGPVKQVNGLSYKSGSVKRTNELSSLHVCVKHLNEFLSLQGHVKQIYDRTLVSTGACETVEWALIPAEACETDGVLTSLEGPVKQLNELSSLQRPVK